MDEKRLTIRVTQLGIQRKPSLVLKIFKGTRVYLKHILKRGITE